MTGETESLLFEIAFYSALALAFSLLLAGALLLFCYVAERRAGRRGAEARKRASDRARRVFLRVLDYLP